MVSVTLEVFQRGQVMNAIQINTGDGSGSGSGRGFRDTVVGVAVV